ncbi:sulfatase-like hydrolase/transferase (plasmid) [Halarchaeum sp. CBA1220]|uniref:sulfatase-like hydrolase/transferase n=1 Tax=Halarchaeum sp. CBA1220 TaxID=1853682 RepID=UPI000F3AA68F|nr:sulfatase-like hydrolase/transferase [Halarchaeum sp. CBA1220]QLC35105.1 sulfatase-like hydrolase/transferase [Halarchaeum sp. CBA1220]
MVRNIVVLCLDSVRKDYFDRYAGRIKSASDISFEAWRSTSSWTVPSHGSMFTGDLPHKSGIHINNCDIGGVSRNKTLIGDLADYKTICASANGFLSPAFTADSLFDEFIYTAPSQRFTEGININNFKRKESGEDRTEIVEFLRSAITHDHPLKSFLNGAFMKLNYLPQNLPVPSPFDDGSRVIQNRVKSTLKTQEQPVFLFVNLMEAHGPHQPMYNYDRGIYTGPLSWSSSELTEAARLPKDNVEEPELKYFREIYAAAIDYLDRKVKKMIEEWTTVLEGETTFIITSDHGENLGYESEDYRLGHESSLSEGLLHVPMEIINPPAGKSPDSSSLYSHLDFRDLIGGLAQDHWNISPRDSVPAERVGTDLDQGTESAERMIRTIIGGGKKYIWDSQGASKWFDIEISKPSMQEPTTENHQVDISEFFDRSIDDVLGSMERRGEELPEESIDRLEDLGYI